MDLFLLSGRVSPRRNTTVGLFTWLGVSALVKNVCRSVLLSERISPRQTKRAGSCRDGVYSARAANMECKPLAGRRGTLSSKAARCVVDQLHAHAFHVVGDATFLVFELA